MTKLTKVRSSVQPPEIQVTASLVLVASNIQEYEQSVEGQIIVGYEYDYDIYTKDEYILIMAEKTNAIVMQLKIILISLSTIASFFEKICLSGFPEQLFIYQKEDFSKTAAGNATFFCTTLPVHRCHILELFQVC